MKHKPFTLDKVSHRPARFAERVKEELTTFVPKELKDPRLYGVKFMTFTSVELAADFRNGNVMFSLMTVETDPARIKEIESALNAAANYIRHELMKRLATKVTPMLHFKYDKGLDLATELDPLYKKIKDERKE